MKKLLYLFLFCTGTLGILKAQGDIQVFGFFQSYASQSASSTQQTIPTLPGFPVLETKDESGNVAMQQANIFASKDLGGKFGAFINLEFVNNYSSERGWGKFNLQEAFVKYEGSNYFNIKAGMFLPAFNNLYEIYNRMPLLPYIARPFVYETAFNTLLPPEDYLPQRAMLQVYGYLPVNDETKIDYAVYLTNPEDAYIAGPNAVNLQVPGWSTVSLRGIGTRVGVRSGTLKAGATLNLDTDNKRGDTSLAKANGSGDIARMRIGADLSYSIAGFTVSGEMIMVKYSLSDAAKQYIESNPLLGSNMDKMFYYVTLQYDLNDDLFVYGMFNSISDNYSNILQDPLVGYSGGLGYRANDNVVIKAQFQHYKLDSKYPDSPATPGLGGKPLFLYSSNTAYAGVSVAF
jgi:hypothetical protein